MWYRERFLYGLLAAGMFLFLTGPSGGSCGTAYSYLECKPGTTEACYAGPDNTAGVGLCKKGSRTCTDDGLWTACTGMVVPTDETCNGKDDDCNGKSDDLMKVPSCKLQKGVCAGAKKKCGGSAGMPSCGPKDYQAQNKAYVAEETNTHCDGLDNDCDGDIDEGCDCQEGQSRSCYGGKVGCLLSGGSYQCKGLCKEGTQICQQGKWSRCKGERLPANKEECNGKDDNCDGQTDEGCACQPNQTQPCGVSTKGSCKKGTQTCDSNGVWQSCQGEVKPQAETCNGKDDDCNGQIDDRPDGKPIQKVCYTGPAPTNGQGPCRSGMRECIAGRYSDCKGQVTPSKERCDRKDNDCNGKIDDGTTLCVGGQVCGNGQCRTPPEKVFRRGTFVGSKYTVSGDVEVLKGASGERVVFKPNFSTDSGPGLRIYLVNDAQGKVVEKPANFIDLGSIKNNKGMQTYSVPTGQSAANFKSVIVWCKTFGVLFGFATLK